MDCIKAVQNYVDRMVRRWSLGAWLELRIFATLETTVECSAERSPAKARVPPGSGGGLV